MKNILYVLLALSLPFLFNGCEKDSNGRMPDDIEDSNTGIVRILESSDVLVDVNNLNQFNLDLEVDVLFDDVSFQKIDLVVVFNDDYASPYVLKSNIQNVPVTLNYTIDDIVAVVDDLSSSTEIVEGDKFNIYTSIELENGNYLPGYLETGEPTNSPSVRNIIGILKGGTHNFLLPVPCPFVENDFVGTMDVYEQWNDGSGDVTYTAEVTINEDLTNENEVVYDIVGLFTGDASTLYQVKIDRKTYSVSHYADPATPPAEQEIVYDGDLFGWGVGRLWFEEFSESLMETCQGYIQFTVTPTLNDIGAWFGSSVTYYIGPGALDAGGGKKSTDYTGPKDEELLKALLISR